MEKSEIICLGILLVTIVLVLPFVMAASITLNSPKQYYNYSTSMNISINHDVTNATNATCYYNKTGGQAGTGLTVISNTTANQSTFENAIFTLNTSLSELGTYNISCTVVNMTYVSIGNISTVTDVTIDYTPPNVTWSFPVAYWNRSGVIQINVTILDSMKIYTNISVNISLSASTQQTFLNLTNQTAGGTSFNVTFNTATLSDGAYNLSIIVRDQAGNINRTEATGNVTFDNTAPSVLTFTKSTSSTTTSLILNLVLTDPGSGVNETCSLSRSGATITGTNTVQTITESTLSCSTSYGYVLTCKDHSGNTLTSTTYSFTTDSCGANSAAGGGGGGTTWTSTYVVTDEQFKEGYAKELTSNTRAKIKVGTSTHYIGVKSVTSNEVTVEISSDPIQVKLNVGEDAKADVNSDGTYDIYVKLNGITGNKADILIKKISETVTEGEGTVVTSEGGEITVGTEAGEIAGQEKGEKGKFSWGWIIIIILVIAAIGGGIAAKKRK